MGNGLCCIKKRSSPTVDLREHRGSKRELKSQPSSSHVCCIKIKIKIKIMGDGLCCINKRSPQDVREHRGSKLELTSQPSSSHVAVPPTVGQQIQREYNGTDNSTQNQVGLKEYTYKEIADATGSFNHTYLVGKGAFGEVYIGKLRNQTVAIKRLNSEASEQQAAAFMEEIRALQTIHHENLVKLFGFCCEGKNRLIVCEYCPNLSLCLHLYETGTIKEVTMPWGGTQSMHIDILSWERRMQIAIGSAKGLQYLHQDCESKIIHRDIKPSNIVLDADYKPKVVDFGLAKFFPMNGSITHISSKIKGTPVYADPEHYPDQKVSYKSDVYSYGVVLLVLISGRKSNMNGVTILEWAKPLIKNVPCDENKIEELIDPKLRDMHHGFRKSEMEVFLFCAAACVYKPSNYRPTMKQIVEALEKKILPNEIWEKNRDFVYLEPISSIPE